MDVKYGFTSLVKTGVPNRLPELFTDEQLYAINKERFNFYQQLLGELSTAGPRVPDAVFGIANRNRYVIEKLRDDMNALANSIAVLRSRAPLPNQQKDELTAMLERLNAQLKSNVFLKEYKFAEAAGGGQAGGVNEPPVADAPAVAAAPALAKPDDPVAELQQKLAAAKNLTGAEAKRQALAKLSVSYENDPIMAPSVDEITSTDRVIFIAVTFLFRGVALFLTEWAMNSYMFTGFHAAIVWYCAVYLSLVVLLALLVNASTKVQLFRMMFYYLSFKPHGPGRLLLHALVLLMLLPIPFLVRESLTGLRDGDAEDHTFARRRSIMRVLSNLTFFIWVLTSVIAARF